MEIREPGPADLDALADLRIAWSGVEAVPQAGRAPVEALLAEADRRGIPRATVHSSPAAVRLSERVGFRSSPELLERAR